MSKFEINLLNFKDLSVEVEPNLEFAAQELKKYLSDAMGERVDFSKGKLRIILTCNSKMLAASKKVKYDGFVISASRDNLVIYSAFERGVLFGVYEFLKHNGYSFIKAAGIGESYKGNKRFVYSGEKIFNPDYEIRGLTNLGGDLSEAWKEECADLIDWAAKHYINAIFLHENINQISDSINRTLFAEIKKRGLIAEFGGHGAEHFVSRELFEAHPEYFIEKDGKRVKSGNLCVSSKEALELLKDNVYKIVNENPDLDVLHIWFEDSVEGSWCECPNCREMSASRQLSNVINEISESLKKDFPKLKLDILLYHETLDDIKNIKLKSNRIFGFFAPRERCYAHSIGEKSCSENRTYLKKLKDAVDVFGQENIYVFEYYMDLILYSKNKTVFGRTISRDLKEYLSAGVNKICPLAFGSYSFWAYEFNMHIYASCCFNTSLNYKSLIMEFLKKAGIKSRLLYKYLRKTEKYSRLYFGFCGYNGIYADIRKVPLGDFTKKHLENIEKAIALMKECRGILLKLCAKFPEKEYFKNELDILEITIMESVGLYERTKIRYKNYLKQISDRNEVIEKFSLVKKGLYDIIEFSKKISASVKGVHGDKLFIEHLCKDQIWTANELLVQEFGIEADLDRSKL